MSVLLPPSPSAVPLPRTSPTPSPLGSSTPADGIQHSPRVTPYANPAASSSSTSLNSLSSLQNYSFGNEPISSSIGTSHMRSYSYSALHAAFTSSTTDPLTGPAIRPLDFGRFINSHEGVEWMTFEQMSDEFKSKNNPPVGGLMPASRDEALQKAKS